LYINSQQRINSPTAIYIQGTAPAISHNGVSDLPYLNVNIDTHTTCNLCYIKFPRRLTKVAQTAPKGHGRGTYAIVTMMMHNVASLQCAALSVFCVK